MKILEKFRSAPRKVTSLRQIIKWPMVQIQSPVAIQIVPCEKPWMCSAFWQGAGEGWRSAYTHGTRDAHDSMSNGDLYQEVAATE